MKRLRRSALAAIAISLALASAPARASGASVDFGPLMLLLWPFVLVSLLTSPSDDKEVAPPAMPQSGESSAASAPDSRPAAPKEQPAREPSD